MRFIFYFYKLAWSLFFFRLKNLSIRDTAYKHSSQGPQGFILRFDQVRLDTGFKFTDVVITPKGDLRLKVGAEKLKIKNIKKAKLRL